MESHFNKENMRPSSLERTPSSPESLKVKPQQLNARLRSQGVEKQSPESFGPSATESIQMKPFHSKSNFETSRSSCIVLQPTNNSAETSKYVTKFSAESRIKKVENLYNFECKEFAEKANDSNQLLEQLKELTASQKSKSSDQMSLMNDTANSKHGEFQASKRRFHRVVEMNKNRAAFSQTLTKDQFCDSKGESLIKDLCQRARDLSATRIAKGSTLVLTNAANLSSILSNKSGHDDDTEQDQQVMSFGPNASTQERIEVEGINSEIEELLARKVQVEEIPLQKDEILQSKIKQIRLTREEIKREKNSYQTFLNKDERLLIMAEKTALRLAVKEFAECVNSLNKTICEDAINGEIEGLYFDGARQLRDLIKILESTRLQIINIQKHHSEITKSHKEMAAQLKEERNRNNLLNALNDKFAKQIDSLTASVQELTEQNDQFKSELDAVETRLLRRTKQLQLESLEGTQRSVGNALVSFRNQHFIPSGGNSLNQTLQASLSASKLAAACREVPFAIQPFTQEKIADALETECKERLETQNFESNTQQAQDAVISASKDNLIKVLNEYVEALKKQLSKTRRKHKLAKMHSKQHSRNLSQSTINVQTFDQFCSKSLPSINCDESPSLSDKSCQTRKTCFGPDQNKSRSSRASKRGASQPSKSAENLYIVTTEHDNSSRSQLPVLQHEGSQFDTFYKQIECLTKQVQNLESQFAKQQTSSFNAVLIKDEDTFDAENSATTTNQAELPPIQSLSVSDDDAKYVYSTSEPRTVPAQSAPVSYLPSGLNSFRNTLQRTGAHESMESYDQDQFMVHPQPRQLARQPSLSQISQAHFELQERYVSLQQMYHQLHQEFLVQNSQLNDCKQLAQLLQNKWEHADLEQQKLHIEAEDIHKQLQFASDAMMQLQETNENLNEHIAKIKKDWANEKEALLKQIKDDESLRVQHERQWNHNVRAVEDEIKMLQQVQQEKIQRMQDNFNSQLQGQAQEMENMDMEYLKAQSQLQKQNEALNVQLAEQKELNMQLASKYNKLEDTYKRDGAINRTEIIKLQDDNTRLKSELVNLENQTLEDLKIKDKLNENQMALMKRQMHQTLFGQENKHISSVQFQDEKASMSPCQLFQTAVLVAELKEKQQTLMNLQDLIKNKISIFDKNKVTFDVFKLKVLEEIIDWHQKTHAIKEHVEKNAKMLFEYFKVTQDLKKVLAQNQSLIKYQKRHISYLTTQLKQSGTQNNQDLTLMLSNFRSISKQNAASYRLKCDEIKVLQETENTLRKEIEFHKKHNNTLLKEMDTLLSEIEILKTQNQKHINDQQRLRTELYENLGLNDRTNDLKGEILQYKNQNMELLVQHQESLITIEQLDKEIANLRELYQQQIYDLEQTIETQDLKHRKEKDEINQDITKKEQNFEKEAHYNSMKITKLREEIEFEQRKYQKIEKELQEEVNKFQVVKDQLEQTQIHLSKETQLTLGLRNDKEILENKLKYTEQVLDQRGQKVTNMEFEIKALTEAKNIISKDNDDLTFKVRKYLDELSQKKEEISILKESSQQRLNEIITLKDQEIAEIKDKLSKVNFTLAQTRNKEAQLYQDIKKYQDTISYLSRDLDKKQDRLSDLSSIQSKFLALQNQHDLLLAGKPRIQESGVQTDSPLSDSEQEVKDLQTKLKLESKKKRDRELEIKQMKEAIQRQEKEIERLIKDKRELENEVSRQTSVRQIQQIQSRTSLKHADSSERSPHDKNLEHILQEKDNFIQKLDKELNQLREENERLKDKCIELEMESLLAKGRGAKDASTAHKRTLQHDLAIRGFKKEKQ